MKLRAASAADDLILLGNRNGDRRGGRFGLRSGSGFRRIDGGAAPGAELSAFAEFGAAAAAELFLFGNGSGYGFRGGLGNGLRRILGHSVAAALAEHVFRRYVGAADGAGLQALGGDLDRIPAVLAELNAGRQRITALFTEISHILTSFIRRHIFSNIL